MAVEDGESYFPEERIISEAAREAMEANHLADIVVHLDEQLADLLTTRIALADSGSEPHELNLVDQEIKETQANIGYYSKLRDEQRQKALDMQPAAIDRIAQINHDGKLPN
jgi:hypothetical protein